MAKESTLENLVINPQFWEKKKVFITGHTGFKGSWLSLWLQKLGAEVIGYSLEPPTNPSLFVDASVGSGMCSIINDIRNSEYLFKKMKETEPEIVIHMAAQSLVRYSYDHPVETYEVNVIGTVNLLEAVRHCESVKTVLVITSDKCYENKEWIWGYRENDPVGGQDPYSSSKGCVELVCTAYRKSYFNTKKQHAVKLATARAGNVIGGGDWAKDRLIPDLVRGSLGNTPVLIRNQHAVRPWQYVFEPLNGYLILIEKLYQEGEIYSGSWNFGPRENNVKPVSWVVKKIGDLYDNIIEIEFKTDTENHEANILRLDSSKAYNYLNWSPLYDLNKSIEETITWYKTFQYEKNKIREITLNQMADYHKSLQQNYSVK